MFEGSKTPLNIFVEIWILQILMSVKLNFWYQQTVYILMAWKDPYGGLQNPYFLELQQKNVAAGENCPYVNMCISSLQYFKGMEGPIRRAPKSLYS